MYHVYIHITHSIECICFCYASTRSPFPTNLLLLTSLSSNSLSSSLFFLSLSLYRLAHLPPTERPCSCFIKVAESIEALVKWTDQKILLQISHLYSPVEQQAGSVKAIISKSSISLSFHLFSSLPLSTSLDFICCVLSPWWLSPLSLQFKPIFITVKRLQCYSPLHWLTGRSYRIESNRPEEALEERRCFEHSSVENAEDHRSAVCFS